MKVDTFFTNFDLLTDAPNATAKLRELILQLAVMGKLVRQDPNDEPAAVLLDRIICKKQQLSYGKKTQKADLNLSNEEELDLEILPGNWCWTNLETIGLINPRNSLPDDLDVAFIPMNLIPQKYGNSVKYETRKWGEVKKGFTHFAEGDVAIAKITPCFQNGKSCVMRSLKNQAGAGTTELHIFRSINNLTYPEYVLIYFKSVSFIKNAIPIMTGTAGQKRVPNNYVAQNPFPLPPLAEQKRIVEKCDRLMSLCDEIEKQHKQKQDSIVRMNESAIAQLLSSQNPDDFRHHWERICNNFDLLYSVPETIPKLRQAILQLAVMGKLVRQDPNDQPAAVLLERIKEEREHLISKGELKKEKLLPSVYDDEVLHPNVLKRPDFLHYVNSKTYGINLPRLGTEDGRRAIFPLPPLAEQKRIVEKCDRLMSLCDRLEAKLKQGRESREKLMEVAAKQVLLN